MKTGMLLAFVVISVSSLSSGANARAIADKSLHVGSPETPNPFSVCIANQAVIQLFSSTNKFLRLLHSSPDLDHDPAMTAILTFLTEQIGDTKKNIFRIELTSLDANLGWRLVQHSNGEIAPFSGLISSKAVLKSAGGASLGDVDLSPCSDQ